MLSHTLALRLLFTLLTAVWLFYWGAAPAAGQQECGPGGQCPAGQVCRASDNTCQDTGGPTRTPTSTPTATPTSSPTATPTSTGAPIGAGCTDAANCTSGNCVDHVCCADASCPPGESCDNPLHVGTCSPDPIAPAPALSRVGVLLALAILVALGGVAVLRRRHGA